MKSCRLKQFCSHGFPFSQRPAIKIVTFQIGGISFLLLYISYMFLKQFYLREFKFFCCFAKHCLANGYIWGCFSTVVLHIHQIKYLGIFLFGAKSPKRDATFNLGFDLSPESPWIALPTHTATAKLIVNPLPPIPWPRFRNGVASPGEGSPPRGLPPLPSGDLNSLALLFISDLANQAEAVGHTLGQKCFQVLL